jgi:hypothetical protein
MLGDVLLTVQPVVKMRTRFLTLNLPNFVILSAAKDLLSRAPKRKPVLRCAQDDNS